MSATSQGKGRSKYKVTNLQDRFKLKPAPDSGESAEDATTSGARSTEATLTAPAVPAHAQPSVDETPVDETPVDETPVDETPVDETPVGPAAKPVATRGAASGGARRREKAPAAVASEQADEQVPVNVDVEWGLYEQLVDLHAGSRLTYEELFFTAIDATAARLGELVVDEVARIRAQGDGPTVTLPPTSSSLFDRPAVAGGARLRSDQPTKQMTFRTARRNREVLAQLQREHGAPTRNVLMNAALRGLFAQLSETKGIAPDAKS